MSTSYGSTQPVSACWIGNSAEPASAGSAPNEELREAVARLPWDLRLPLVMYYFDGRSVKAVARALEMSTSGVYLKLRTAIGQLHDILTQQGETQ